MPSPIRVIGAVIRRRPRRRAGPRRAGGSAARGWSANASWSRVRAIRARRAVYCWSRWWPISCSSTSKITKSRSVPSGQAMVVCTPRRPSRRSRPRAVAARARRRPAGPARSTARAAVVAMPGTRPRSNAPAGGSALPKLNRPQPVGAAFAEESQHGGDLGRADQVLAAWPGPLPAQAWQRRGATHSRPSPRPGTAATPHSFSALRAAYSVLVSSPPRDAYGARTRAAARIGRGAYAYSSPCSIRWCRSFRRR